MQFDHQRTQLAMIRPRRSRDEVNSSSFRANVPFSWEKKPGTSKLKPSSFDHRSLDHYFTATTLSLKLIPPPARLSSQYSFSGTPCPRESRRGPSLCSNVDVQPSVATIRNSFRLTGGASPAAARNNCLLEDPFFAAFIKCTQMHSNSGKRYVYDDKSHNAATKVSAGKKNSIFSRFTSTFSCKHSCAVSDDSLVVTMSRKSSR